MSQGADATRAPRRALSIASLVLGVLAVPGGYSLVLPAAAIIVGVIAKGREPHAEGLARWGIGLGIAGLVLGLVLVAVLGTAPLGLLGVDVSFDLD